MEKRLSAWDERLNHLPRKAALVAVTLGLAGIGVLALRYVWPFAAAFLFSRMLEPFVRTASKGFSRFGEDRARSLATLAGMLLLFGLAGFAFAALAGRLLTELTGFLKSLPQLFGWLSDVALPTLLAFYDRWKALLPAFLPEMIEEGVASLGQNAVRWAGSLSAWITGGAWNTAAGIPTALLSLVMLVMATYYLTADRARIAGYLHRLFPKTLMRRSRLIRASLIRALLGQMRSQLTVSLVVMFFLMVTLGVAGVRYGGIIGVLIGLADAMPVVGAGLFLIPWGIASLLAGQTGMGVTLLCLYVGAVLIRQILEPRLVGRQLGLYPLATMAAMYVGYRLLGFLGLLGGPILLQLSKAVLEADRASRTAGT